MLQAILEAIVESIGECPECDGAFRAEGLNNGAGAAIAATDKHDFERFVASGVDGLGHRGGDAGGCNTGGSGFQKLSTRLVQINRMLGADIESAVERYGDRFRECGDSPMVGGHCQCSQRVWQFQGSRARCGRRYIVATQEAPAGCSRTTLLVLR